MTADIDVAVYNLSEINQPLDFCALFFPAPVSVRNIGGIKHLAVMVVFVFQLAEANE